MKNVFYLLVALLYGCDNDHSKTNILNPTDVGQNSRTITSPKLINPYLGHDDSFIEFTNSNHFQKVKRYIEKIGKHDRISASAMLDDTSMMVDYYSIEREGWKITKDHHTRIYFSYNSHSYGNIFLVHDSVHVEPYYLGPKEDIDTLNEIIRPITKLYNTLVNKVREK